VRITERIAEAMKLPVGWLEGFDDVTIVTLEDFLLLCRKRFIVSEHDDKRPVMALVIYQAVLGSNQGRPMDVSESMIWYASLAVASMLLTEGGAK
jgi:hypothetical protein